MKIPSVFVGLFAFSAAIPCLAGDGSNLESLLAEALAQNFSVKASAENVRAEKKKITSQYNLADPSIGLSRLDRGAETDYLTIQQKIRFPTKYLLAGKSQRRSYESNQSTLNARKLEIRKEVIEVYFSLYSVQKTIQLTNVNLQLVRDFARIAEKKYAARKSSQGDSMKAHFEMTQLELNLLNLEQEESLLQSKMTTLLGRQQTQKLNLSHLEIDAPEVALQSIEADTQAISEQITKTSPSLIAQEKKYQASKVKHSLAKWEFAPDFNIQYQKRIAGRPEDSNIVSINATIPLWFWKNSAQASTASAKANSEDYKLQGMKLKYAEELRSLKIRIQKANKALIIYRTTLMPQAEGAYRSSRSAYKAGSATFLDLLDAERSLYSVKQSYYRALTFFVKDVVAAETILGASISNLSGMKRDLK